MTDSDRTGPTPDAAASGRASRRGWDDYARQYQAEHGDFLGGDDGVRFVWGPEGLSEADARLLGPAGGLRGRIVLEVGAGAAQCGRWLAREEGAHVVAFDVSAAQIAHAAALQQAHPVEPAVALLEADAAFLPFREGAFDLVVSSHGGLAFVPDLAPVFCDIARVLRPGGRVVASLPHPMRWIFPDSPDEHGLTAIRSYFDAEPYVEYDGDGDPAYVEHHHTLEHVVMAILRAGLMLDLVHEVRWPEGDDRRWGGWGPITGRMYPRTLIVGATRPG